jgi:hypothetical protein
MKVLSIMQPWASLIVMGAKQIETRSWMTTYRGPLLIHANASPRHAKQVCNFPLYKQFFRHWTDLPYGCIIGEVTLASSEPAEDIKDLLRKKANLLFDNFIADPAMELELGNFSEGRYGWILSNPKKFQNLIETKGQIRIWDFEMPLNITHMHNTHVMATRV